MSEDRGKNRCPHEMCSRNCERWEAHVWPPFLPYFCAHRKTFDQDEVRPHIMAARHVRMRVLERFPQDSSGDRWRVRPRQAVGAAMGAASALAAGVAAGN